jgi:hypothetical protein
MTGRSSDPGFTFLIFMLETDAGGGTAGAIGRKYRYGKFGCRELVPGLPRDRAEAAYLGLAGLISQLVAQRLTGEAVQGYPRRTRKVLRVDVAGQTHRLSRLYSLPFPELNDGIAVFGQLPIIGILPDTFSGCGASGQVLSSALVDQRFRRLAHRSQVFGRRFMIHLGRPGSFRSLRCTYLRAYKERLR